MGDLVHCLTVLVSDGFVPNVVCDSTSMGVE